jgi:hypothetical protein
MFKIVYEDSKNKNPKTVFVEASSREEALSKLSDRDLTNLWEVSRYTGKIFANCGVIK